MKHDLSAHYLHHAHWGDALAASVRVAHVIAWLIVVGIVLFMAVSTAH